SMSHLCCNASRRRRQRAGRLTARAPLHTVAGCFQEHPIRAKVPDIMKKPSSQPHRHAGPPGAELDAEAARVAALEALALLDTAPEPEFDQLTQLAADIFEVPMVAVSLVARTRQWFKSSV
ncbi:hypothetical protein RZS08_24450, partial [Arthrospira platensis SPKY1]|nr:hypothetical protein [Arthrospira platensis SPKY1]